MISTFTLPLPPSVNELWANNSKRRWKSLKYKNWIDAAGWEIRKQRPGAFLVPVTLRYEVADRGRFDLGNIEKALTDLLVTHFIIKDDSRKFVRKITMEWADNVHGVRVTVASSPVEQQGAAGEP